VRGGYGSDTPPAFQASIVARRHPWRAAKALRRRQFQARASINSDHHRDGANVAARESANHAIRAS
jgi:hypothetical protein